MSGDASIRHDAGNLNAGVEAERLARAGLSRCCEPGDATLAAAVAALGAQRVWELVQGAPATDSDKESMHALAEAEGSATGRGPSLKLGVERWRSRSREANPSRDLSHARLLGGGYVIPGDDQWPVAVDDLGPEAPLGLWWRGPGIQSLGVVGSGPWTAAKTLSVVGTRDPSAYGVHVTTTMVATLRERNVCIVSGGALGIDITAHRAALEHGESLPATVCVLAGGIDRLYPATNAATLGELASRHLVLSEHPPGCAATRWRFLARNRIIASLGAGTVVTEGRWRSGALNTANHAASLGRWLGAIPGAVTSGTSELAHRLIRDTGAELISRPEDI